MTFREEVAARVFVLLMARQGSDQDEYPELACEYADDLAAAACARWGHDRPVVEGGSGFLVFDGEKPPHCKRCGKQVP